MKRLLLIACLVSSSSLTSAVFAQNVLIKNATVHTTGTRGSMKNSDVLVQGGIIRAIGPNLSAPGIVTVDAKGKSLTPGLFAGLGDIGLEEVSAEKSTVDGSFSLGETSSKPISPRPANNPGVSDLPLASTVTMPGAERFLPMARITPPCTKTSLFFKVPRVPAVCTVAFLISRFCANTDVVNEDKETRHTIHNKRFMG